MSFSMKTIMIEKKRESNIELLRILAMIGVIVLHYNNSEIGGALKYVQPDSLNEIILLALESMFICAVDVFVLITGYFLSNSRKRNLDKLG